MTLFLVLAKVAGHLLGRLLAPPADIQAKVAQARAEIAADTRARLVIADAERHLAHCSQLIAEEQQP